MRGEQRVLAGLRARDRSAAPSTSQQQMTCSWPRCLTSMASHARCNLSSPLELQLPVTVVFRPRRSSAPARSRSPCAGAGSGACLRATFSVSVAVPGARSVLRAPASLRERGSRSLRASVLLVRGRADRAAAGHETRILSPREAIWRMERLVSTVSAAAAPAPRPPPPPPPPALRCRRSRSWRRVSIVSIDRAVGADAAVDLIGFAVAGVDRVVAERHRAGEDPAEGAGRVREDRVAPWAAGDRVVVEPGHDAVVARSAVDAVGAVERRDRVVAAPAAHARGVHRTRRR